MTAVYDDTAEPDGERREREREEREKEKIFESAWNDKPDTTNQFILELQKRLSYKKITANFSLLTLQTMMECTGIRKRETPFRLSILGGVLKFSKHVDVQ